MNRDFECVWEELRPAPHVTIDFKNGYVLERTLNGNVATLFTTPEGGVFDVLPGIMRKASYVSQLTDATNRYRHLHGARASAESVRADCKSRAEALSQLPFVFFPPGVVDDIAIGKGIVEQPIKVALGKDGKPLSEGDLASLNADTETVFRTLLPAALDLLAKHPLAAPEELTNELFRDILHVDLEDPYLGLAVDAIGGRLGRFGPDAPDGPVKPAGHIGPTGTPKRPR